MSYKQLLFYKVTSGIEKEIVKLIYGSGVFRQICYNNYVTPGLWSNLCNQSEIAEQYYECTLHQDFQNKVIYPRKGLQRAEL